jgi:hypothetical protein
MGGGGGGCGRHITFFYPKLLSDSEISNFRINSIKQSTSKVKYQMQLKLPSKIGVKSNYVSPNWNISENKKTNYVSDHAKWHV